MRRRRTLMYVSMVLASFLLASMPANASYDWNSEECKSMMTWTGAACNEDKTYNGSSFSNPITDTWEVGVDNTADFEVVTYSENWDAQDVTFKWELDFDYYYRDEPECDFQIWTGGQEVASNQSYEFEVDLDAWQGPPNGFPNETKTFYVTVLNLSSGVNCTSAAVKCYCRVYNSQDIPISQLKLSQFSFAAIL